MKKLLTIALVATMTGAYAQKADTTKKTEPKPVYKKVIILSPVDYQQLVNRTAAYKDLIIYSPFIEKEDKLSGQHNINVFLFGLQKKVKLDSVKVSK